MTINTTASTPAGSSIITVTATGGGITKTTTFSLTTSLPTVAAPTISPNGGSYTGSISVTMQTATSGASIYYTTNGSTPTQSSTLYTGAMTLASSATVKAKAFKNGFNSSAEASASFTVTQPFSFSLANSGNKSVTAGSSVTNSISTTLSSGSSQAVTFSVSGLPAGATGSFSSASCSPACSTGLNISTTGSTPAGNFPITVSATGGGVSKTTVFTLTVSVAPVATTPILNVSPTAVAAGGMVTATWSGIVAPSSTDWIGLYAPSAADTNFISWMYVSCTKTASNALASGSCSYTLPATLAAGNYELRLFSNDGYTRLATSKSFSVALVATTPILNVSPTAVAAGGMVTAAWSGIVAPSSRDWIGLYAPSAADTNFISWMYVSCTKTASNALASGSCSYTLPATLAAGNYELRLFSNDSYTRLATSRSFSVSQPVASPAGQPFSFSLSNSGDKSVTAGSSVTNSISTTLSSGSSQAVSFSVSGLPSGATGSFSSASCNPACSTVLNVSTTGSTPAGNFPITVTSTGGGVTKTTAFTLSVTLALTVATPTITPNGGNFSGSVSVAMQSATSGASIYYTTDGSTPTQSSTLYTGAMTLTSNTVVKAKAFKSGSNPSAEASASFTVSQLQVAGRRHATPMVSFHPTAPAAITLSQSVTVQARTETPINPCKMLPMLQLQATQFGSGALLAYIRALAVQVAVTYGVRAVHKSATHNRTIIEGYQNELPSIAVSAVPDSGGVRKFCHMCESILDGANQPSRAIGIFGMSFSRFENVEVKNYWRARNIWCQWTLNLSILMSITTVLGQTHNSIADISLSWHLCWSQSAY